MQDISTICFCHLLEFLLPFQLQDQFRKGSYRPTTWDGLSLNSQLIAEQQKKEIQPAKTLYRSHVTVPWIIIFPITSTFWKNASMLSLSNTIKNILICSKSKVLMTDLPLIFQGYSLEILYLHTKESLLKTRLMTMIWPLTLKIFNQQTGTPCVLSHLLLSILTSDGELSSDLLIFKWQTLRTAA